MDINKLDMKKTLIAGSALAVMSGFVPPVSNTAVAGTASVDVSLEVVTAIALDTTTPLDFGRLAIATTGAISGNHTLSPLGVTSVATNATVINAGSPGSFNIAAGDDAASVEITLSAPISYNAGDIIVNQLTFGGPGMGATVAVAASATGAAASFAGGGATDVRVGGRIAFSGTPNVGTYNTGTFTININDVP
ncbi:MAG: hypothetical protein CL561_01570 [Alphaproteobacteria bacterium]|nr:hypothetical protein [Alphaproteobacteria bacterium]|tara:strand:- start:80457 stop:81035 length:579 start_codon:yes stop_codon:yes gene_type:complete